jgi:hypothetical protein
MESENARRLNGNPALGGDDYNGQEPYSRPPTILGLLNGEHVPLKQSLPPILQ